MCCANCARAPCFWPKPPASQQPLLWLSPPSTVPLLLTSAIQRENHHFLAFFPFGHRDSKKRRTATSVVWQQNFIKKSLFAPIDVWRRSAQKFVFCFGRLSCRRDRASVPGERPGTTNRAPRRGFRLSGGLPPFGWLVGRPEPGKSRPDE